MPNTLTVAVPTHDSRAVVQTLLEIMQVGREMARPVWVVTTEASNIPKGRNLVLERIRDHINPSRASGRPWVMWIDSDIVIPPDSYGVIAKALLWAETNNRCIAANYMMGSGTPVLMKSRDPEQAYHYTMQELNELPAYAEVGMAGFGFLYLQQPVDYVFHADRVGEDVHFWWDNPDIAIHYAKDVRLGHKKFVTLSPDMEAPRSAALSVEHQESPSPMAKNRQQRRAVAKRTRR